MRFIPVFLTFLMMAMPLAVHADDLSLPPPANPDAPPAEAAPPKAEAPVNYDMDKLTPPQKESPAQLNKTESGVGDLHKREHRYPEKFPKKKHPKKKKAKKKKKSASKKHSKKKTKHQGRNKPLPSSIKETP